MQRNWWVIGILLVVLAGTAFAQDSMVITFQNGTKQTIDTSTILKIEFQRAGASAGATREPTGCWTGHFKGNDTSGYAMNINLRQTDGSVEGGYTYYHRGQQKQVSAIITDTAVTGNTLRGTWKQVSGIIAQGRFEWKWLPGSECQAFEGTFDGTKYWHRMAR